MVGPDIAIGILGLAGLFNNAIDWFDYVYIAKKCGLRLQTHLLKLDNAQLRLTRWGDAVGLSGADIDDHNSLGCSFLLSDGQKAHAERIFRSILQKFQACQDICLTYREGKKEDNRGVEQNEIKPFGSGWDPMRQYLHQKMRNISHTRKNKVTMFEKARFAIYDEKHLAGLTVDINGLVDDLYKLFPPPEEKQAQLSKEELDKLIDVLRELETVVKVHDPTLASAVQHILNQKVSEGCRLCNHPGSHVLERYEDRE